ncbi:MAG: hypothetical protein LBT05_07560 [Planctomycetaceae bacterium]|jgi:hypothetical protein|nr:hypothetical protein [Planctomycetaceae bacterium]
MQKPIVSPGFTVEDIRKIREYNYEMTKNMSMEEKRKYYQSGAKEARETIEKIKKERLAKNNLCRAAWIQF